MRAHRSVVVSLLTIACGAEGPGPSGPSPQPSPSQAVAACTRSGDGCTCSGARSPSTLSCNADTTPGSLRCCESGTEGTGGYSCSCLARPYTGAWTCTGSSSYCRCVAGTPSAGGAVTSTCDNTQCVWSARYQFCECSPGGSAPPDSVSVASCTRPPRQLPGSCPSGTTAVFACDATPEPFCDPNTCRGTESFGGVVCYSSCELPNGAISSGRGASCVRHCN